MFENSITLFNIQLPQFKVENRSLSFAACNSYLYTERKTSSEFDELNFICLNCNNGFGFIEIEFCFENNLENPYVPIYGRCFSIRTDNKITIKKNGPLINGIDRNYSKINKENQFVVGICYFFQNDVEREKILSCRQFCIEGFIALGKKTNTYGVMCRLNKVNNEWNIVDASSFRTYKNTNINSLCH